MQNGEVVQFLETIASLLEIKGERPYRVRAYQRAARQVALLAEDIATLAAEDRLTTIPGIGTSLAARIEEFLATGRSSFLDELARDTPLTLLDLLALPGFGPKRVAAVHRALGVTTLDDLAAAAAAGRLRGLRAIGPRLAGTVLRDIERLRERRRRVSLMRARPIALALRDQLAAALPGVPVAVVGSVRRMAETVGGIDLLAAAPGPAAVLDAFAALPGIAAVQGRTPHTLLARTDAGVPCSLAVVPPEAWGAALVVTTGSPAHCDRLLALAAGRGWRIEGTLFLAANGEPVTAPTEAAFYGMLGLPAIPPVLREDWGEIEAAQANALPTLIGIGDMRADLHVHSTWSDGRHSIEEMARAAQARGLSYLVLTDHSRSSVIANGLSVERVLAQRDEIAAVNARLDGFRVLTGIEVDIKSDGSLDYDDELLARLDFVIASIHSGFSQRRDRLTARTLAAIRNPHVDAIAHPTGRLLGSREPLDLDMDAVIAAAAEVGTALEINCGLNRLDLNDALARQARDAGAPLVVNTDAHAVGHFQYMEYGIATAQRGWVRPSDLLNTRSLAALLAARQC